MCSPCIHNRAAALHSAHTSITLLISPIEREKQNASDNLTQMVKFLASAAERAQAKGNLERSVYLREMVRYEMGVCEKRKGERDTDLRELEGRLGRVERALRRGEGTFGDVS